MNPLKTALLSALLATVALAAAPAASAETVCQPIGDTGETLCVTATVDQAGPSAAVGVHIAGVNVCVVVFATCP
jgi:uncharacterized cupredoxin-like copper-binding protein